MRHRLTASLIVVSAVLLVSYGVRAQAPHGAPETRVDALFARYTTDTPGCAAGVSVAGRPVLEKAYGMATLEHGVRNTPETIFEAGSVTKQFTAAAVLLLAQDGRLSLDDPVRKYVPELPDYATPLLVRHMLHHMSGLRDWGSLQAIAGWPRTSRVYTHAHVLDIVARQRALNFTPGTRYSYSNTGYNLAAIIVSRVSGRSFAEFTRERIFQPLGMTRTSWRDDFTRVVRNRAIAYAEERGSFAQDMPFENVHGNGGLLTTVGDLLRWNENFVAPKVGTPAFVRQQQEPGRFNDGRAGTYAFGLMVGRYRGVPEVGHSGSTAGYRAHLARYPDQHVSVAVLCNVSSAGATQYAHAIADIYLGDAVASTPAERPAPRRVEPQSLQLTPGQLAVFAGVYASDEIETSVTVVLEGDTLVLLRRPDTRIVLRPMAEDTFAAGSLGTLRFHRTGGAVTELGVSQERVFDLRFRRIGPAGGG